MIIPVGDRLLIKPDPVETKTASGIVIATNEKIERHQTEKGVILSIGEFAWKGIGNGEPWAKVGDYIYYTRHAGKFVKDGDEEYLVILDEDVLAVIT